MLKNPEVASIVEHTPFVEVPKPDTEAVEMSLVSREISDRVFEDAQSVEELNTPNVLMRLKSLTSKVARASLPAIALAAGLSGTAQASRSTPEQFPQTAGTSETFEFRQPEKLDFSDLNRFEASPEKMYPAINKWAEQWDIPEESLKAIFKKEHGYLAHPYGLMQMTTDTQQYYTEVTKDNEADYRKMFAALGLPADLDRFAMRAMMRDQFAKNPELQIALGAKHLKDDIEKYGDTLGLLAYNNPGAVKEFIGDFDGDVAKANFAIDQVVRAIYGEDSFAKDVEQRFFTYVEEFMEVDGSKKPYETLGEYITFIYEGEPYTLEGAQYLSTNRPDLNPGVLDIKRSEPDQPKTHRDFNLSRDTFY